MLKSLAVITLLGAPFVAGPAQALTRAPTPGTNESSLYYWRSLCRLQVQTEGVVGNNKREVSCPGQRWKVRTKVGEDRVTEVVEDAS